MNGISNSNLAHPLRSRELHVLLKPSLDVARLPQAQTKPIFSSQVGAQASGAARCLLLGAPEHCYARRIVEEGRLHRDAVEPLLHVDGREARELGPGRGQGEGERAVAKARVQVFGFGVPPCAGQLEEARDAGHGGIHSDMDMDGLASCGEAGADSVHVVQGMCARVVVRGRPQKEKGDEARDYESHSAADVHEDGSNMPFFRRRVSCGAVDVGARQAG
mmetsp:Transcript_33213/g.87313  ORF Transcript_33213/g.87313 Transcript_33213/m.87313 type:complete len:219 (+) Transcript_33213:296-952(+)